MIGNRGKPIIIHWTKEEMFDEGNIRPKTLKSNVSNKTLTKSKSHDQKKVEEKANSESHESTSGASLKELCAEDKKRVANLVRELARLEEEKTAMAKVVEEERARFEQQMGELMQQQQQAQQEKDVIQKQLIECQQLITKYHISSHQQHESALGTEGKRGGGGKGGRTVDGGSKQKHHRSTRVHNRHQHASDRSGSDAYSSGDDGSDAVDVRLKRSSQKRDRGEKKRRSASEARGKRSAQAQNEVVASAQGQGQRLGVRPREDAGAALRQGTRDQHYDRKDESEDDASRWRQCLPPVSARTQQLLAEVDVLRDYHSDRVAVGDSAIARPARLAAESVANNYAAQQLTASERERASALPRSENSFIVHAAHVAESSRPFTEVLDRLIAERNAADVVEKSGAASSQVHDLNRRLVDENSNGHDRCVPDETARPLQHYSLLQPHTGVIGREVHGEALVDSAERVTALGADSHSRTITSQHVGVGGPMGDPTMTSTLRGDNERLDGDTMPALIVEAAGGSIVSKLAREEMARQREALMAEQLRLKEILAEQEMLLQRKQHELRVQQETHKQRLQVFEDTGVFPLVRNPLLVAPSAGDSVQSAGDSVRMLGHGVSNALHGHQSALPASHAELQHNSVQTTPKKSANAAMRDTATSPLKPFEASHKPYGNAKSRVLPMFDSDTSLVDLINEVESEYSYYSDRDQAANVDRVNLNVRHCSHGNKCGSDCSCSELEESSLLEQVFFYK